MDSNEEIRRFFDTLIQHECITTLADCPTCQLLQKIYSLTLQLIFSFVIYPEVRIAARRNRAVPDDHEQAGLACDLAL